jgi:alkylation response protein AidB-like acyl-CoA dehydrogenase
LKPIVTCELCETTLVWDTVDRRQTSFVGHSPDFCRSLTKARIVALQAALKTAAQNYAEQHGRDRHRLWEMKFDMDRVRGGLSTALDWIGERARGWRDFQRLRRMADRRDVEERAADLAAAVEKSREGAAVVWSEAQRLELPLIDRDPLAKEFKP